MGPDMTDLDKINIMRSQHGHVPVSAEEVQRWEHEHAQIIASYFGIDGNPRWVRRWWSPFRVRPACKACGQVFPYRGLDEFIAHWDQVHAPWQPCF